MTCHCFGVFIAACPIHNTRREKMSDKSTLDLVMRFWNLSCSQRREIALKLDLIEDADMTIPEPERYSRAFRRAGKQGLLEQLGQEIKQRENN